MNSKLSNISKWVFGALALITVGIAVYFIIKGIPECRALKAWYKDAELLEGKPATEKPLTPVTDLTLLWGYILIGLTILMALCSAIYASVIKGIDVKKIAIIIGAIVVIGVIAYFMSRNSFTVPYIKSDGKEISALGHGIIETGINFFYITFGVSLVAILYSVIRSGK